MSSKIAIVIHGGAGPDSEYIRENEEAYRASLAEIVSTAYSVLEKGGTAVDAVEKAVNMLEDNILFNAGRGSAFTENAHIEMDTAIMDGKNLKSGAAAIVKSVKNPVSFARHIMEKSDHVFLADGGATSYAIKAGAKLENDAYFFSEHQYEEMMKKKKEEKKKNNHGTVGAVALDKDGNLAAATSTGGAANSSEGRVGDSAIIGAGTYANNKTAALSGTGDGEYLIRGVITHDISAVMEYRGLSLKEAMEFIIHSKNKDVDADLGVIGVDAEGNTHMCFNTERMHRAVMSSSQPMQVYIFSHEGEAINS
jgi:beta-aspartyl-peptidase (threonine type)